MKELRCDKKLHGILVAPNVIEIACDSRYCGARAGVTVLHRFDLRTGELIDTKRFQSPGRRGGNAADHHSASVRSA